MNRFEGEAIILGSDGNISDQIKSFMPKVTKDIIVFGLEPQSLATGINGTRVKSFEIKDVTGRIAHDGDPKLLLTGGIAVPGRFGFPGIGVGTFDTAFANIDEDRIAVVEKHIRTIGGFDIQPLIDSIVTEDDQFFKEKIDEKLGKAGEVTGLHIGADYLFCEIARS